MENSLYWSIYTVIIFCWIGFIRGTDPFLCYSCSSAKYQSDCMYIQQCAANEICYVEGRIGPNKTVLYDSGCRRRDQCKAIVPTRDNYNHGKRSPEAACNMCCDENFCNWDICDRQKIAITGPRCLQCTAVTSPKLCMSVAECARDEICYAQQYHNSNGIFYKLGCAMEKVCVRPLDSFVVGKRQFSPGRCSQCCRDYHCNHDLCGSISHADFKLIIDETVNSTGTCEDKSHDLCKYSLSTLGASCADQNIKHLCPKSCNTCEDASCVDKANFSCNEVAKAYNVCADVQKAKLYCKKFCDYCRAVDGSWNGWSRWTQCSLTCGNGTQIRFRNCTNPPPSPLGNPCPGLKIEERNCNVKPCAIDGQWNQWSCWNSCVPHSSSSISCFGHMCLNNRYIRTRTRKCNDPTPQFGGSDCPGTSTDSEELFNC